MKLITKVALALLFFFLSASMLFPVSTHAEETEEVTIEFFYGDGCPHCAKAKPFVESLEQEYDSLSLHTYEVYNDEENYELMLTKISEFGISTFGVPFIVVEDEYFIGYLSDDTTGAEIENVVKAKLSIEQNESTESSVSVPFFDNIEVEKLSLPLLAVILGLLDGFNPCAMWALLFLISILINLEDRRKLFLLGFLFILTSGVVYFLFMSAWLNLFLFINYLKPIRFIIGLAAIGAAGYNFYEFWQNRKGCQKGEKAKRKNIFQKARKAVGSKNIFFAIMGIITLAFSVNLIELACSAGLPAIFTHVLSINDLSGIQYYSFMAMYILFFMLDDLIIFTIAVSSLKLIGIESKYSRISRILGGIVILVIGLLLIFKPDLLLLG